VWSPPGQAWRSSSLHECAGCWQRKCFDFVAPGCCGVARVKDGAELNLNLPPIPTLQPGFRLRRPLLNLLASFVLLSVSIHVSLARTECSPLGQSAKFRVMARCLLVGVIPCLQSKLHRAETLFGSGRNENLKVKCRAPDDSVVCAGKALQFIVLL
jgi:hypothetical protein